MLGCNCSILGDETTREAIVIDPGDDVSKIVDILKRHSLTVKMIVITHAHIDHIGGAHKLRALTGAPVYMHEADKMLSDRLDVQAGWLGMATPEDPGIDVPAQEGDVLKVGSIEAQVLHTPGHTQGSISLYLPHEGGMIRRATRLFEGRHRKWTTRRRRRHRSDQAVNSREALHAAGRDDRVPGPWGNDIHWQGETQQSVRKGPYEGRLSSALSGRFSHDAADQILGIGDRFGDDLNVHGWLASAGARSDSKRHAVLQATSALL